ncbi:sensor histidine kinase [Methylobacterium frigidaeris]|uniref:C4-dicarboxylate transport sensor protein DctB n=1 Tax=Methylobacterium frigidaeris TaxID=2038277 RepID=A0AA37HEP0_9HYPH|nr:ATP-binding protein [Methylobacterium frigidaeris]PIK70457.1 two-component sensor histidine kinase [Methylobacterium frigidaeris]GJD64442.1 C4-dicarboxylate transport sensor protein DctB [Methylobacterium frigidaeris]
MSKARPADLSAPRRAFPGGVGAWRWALAAAVLTLTLAAFLLTLQAGHDQVRRASRQRLVIAEAVLRAAIDRYQYLPTVLALDTQVQDLLADPDAPGAITAVNAKFEAIARASKVAAIYLMDGQGLTRSASNWNQPLSFVGSSYAYRPYFRDALATGASRYFGVGTTTQQPGLFIGKAVPSPNGPTAGVVVVKVDLEDLQGEWRRAGEQILVSDAAGIVFLASEPGWKYRPFRRLAAADTSRIRAAQQYGDSDLRPLLEDGRVDLGETIRLPAGGRTASGLVEPIAMPDLGWTLWYVAPTGPALRQAILVAAATGIAGLALAFALVAASQRRQRLRSEQSMRIALERRVAERTHDLSDANARLRAEISERERATAALRATQDELIHAGRLAALGQISTAINHEINQPLAALRTFLASTTVFLERGDESTVRRNLQRMTEVTQRIAEIIRHLKDFARKTGPGHSEPVRLAATAEAALDLLRVRLRAEDVTVTCAIPADALVRAEPVRLEQVLLNLMVNALDAMRGASERRLDLTARREPASCWQLVVADSGSGISPEHMPQIFDPFFTTKPAGEGLGLGLSLSSLIVRDLGGSLTAGNGARGAVLTLVLPAAEA